jgi:hypothetical protein
LIPELVWPQSHKYVAATGRAEATHTQHHTSPCLEVSRARVCRRRLDSAPSMAIQGSALPPTSNGLVNSPNCLQMVLSYKRPGRPASMRMAGMQCLPAPLSTSKSKPGHSLTGVGPTAMNLYPKDRHGLAGEHKSERTPAAKPPLHAEGGCFFVHVTVTEQMCWTRYKKHFVATDRSVWADVRCWWPAPVAQPMDKLVCLLAGLPALRLGQEHPIAGCPRGIPSIARARWAGSPREDPRISTPPMDPH